MSYECCVLKVLSGENQVFLTVSFLMFPDRIISGQVRSDQPNRCRDVIELIMKSEGAQSEVW